MDEATRALFTANLDRWATELIDRGRYPFRRTETFLPLLTEAGEIAPPLIFWINRDSFMAGGLLFFPGKKEDGSEAGLHCSRALGIECFITWSADEIIFWQEEDGKACPRRKVPWSRPGVNDTASFLKILRQILEELKTFAVLGARPADQLSPFYFANFCRIFLLEEQASLEEAFRVARGENRLSENAPEPRVLTLHKNILTCLRLLALAHCDGLPPGVRPDGLEKAMYFSIDRLSPEIRFLMDPGPDELPLPPASAVRFHHFYRRLVQLRAGLDDTRLAETIRILLQHGSSCLGGFADPFPLSSPEEPILRVNPAYPSSDGSAETGAFPLLAAHALFRFLQATPPAAARGFEPACMELPSSPKTITGTLYDTRIPRPLRREWLTARLRTVWPNRRFSLPPRTPYWVFEFLHLLGLADKGAQINLRLPADWLSEEFGAAPEELIRDFFTLDRLEFESVRTLRLQLVKDSRPWHETVLSGPHGQRRRTWETIREHRSQLLLVLHLPAPIIELLEKERLRSPEKEDLTRHARGIYLFTRSSLGRYLWSIISGGAPLPPRSRLRREILRRKLPLPSDQILKGLGLSSGQNPPSRKDLDGELEAWLGDAARPRKRLGEGKKPVEDPSGTMPPPRESLKESIIQEVFMDGVPEFPAHYLYDYFRPKLTEFTLEGPLKVEGEFFGRIRLRDHKGDLLEVEGPEKARALILSSVHGRVSAALPEDRTICEDITTRYLADLTALKMSLVRTACRRTSEERAARKLAEEIWESMHLPPWSWIGSEKTYFYV